MLLRSLETPLIHLSNIFQESWHQRLHTLLKELDPLRRNTLRFVLEFFEETSFYENDNDMSIEELAECVGPTITSNQWLEWYRDPMIILMQNYEALFEEELK